MLLRLRFLNTQKIKTKPTIKVVVRKLNATPTRQPKARYYTRLNEQDYLGLTVWAGKTDPTAEVIVVQVRRRVGEKWETVGRLAAYRSPNGEYSQLPERR